MPVLGSDPWEFRDAAVEPTGLLGRLVDAAGGEWDLGLVRSPAVLAGVLVALAATLTPLVRRWRLDAAVALTLAVLALLTVPAVLLQVGLRQGSEPWLFTNDSTYQIELAGDLVLDGDNPYGHDYTGSGQERFYPAVGEPREQVALRHFAYFPGTPELAAAWRLLPAPLDDFRVLVLLATLGTFFAALLFRAPLGVRLAAGAVLAGNPLAVRATWFGTADAPSLLLLVLAFALVTRARYGWAAASLAAAVLSKQFALVALPFLAVMVLQRAPRPAAVRAGAVFAAVLAVGALPFLVADPGALWRDTVAYGADTYRIVGYGLSAALLELGVLDDRRGPYPFLPLVLLVWLPVTALLVRSQARAASLWLGGVGFTVSMFLLLYLGRVFQVSYLAWPLTGLVLTVLLAQLSSNATGADERLRFPAGSSATRVSR
ncbi:MAG: hypothetical protein H0T39_13685 [Actinobacteria bacterium]|nr:hypothetical protein [Actinomycetota bacterium]